MNLDEDGALIIVTRGRDVKGILSLHMHPTKRSGEHTGRYQLSSSWEAVLYQEPKSSSHLILDFTDFGNVKNESPLFKPHSLWYFVRAA